jgi:hypothetical protein
MRYLRVRNFEKYQHYKDRQPPWIKLYRDLWKDDMFEALTETERYFLISLFIVASQHDNRIPDNQVWLKEELKTTRRVPIQRLVDTKWFEEIPVVRNVVAACNIASSPPSKNADKTSSVSACKNAPSEETEGKETEQKEGKETEKKEENTLARVVSPIPPYAKAFENDAENTRADNQKDYQKYWGPVESGLRDRHSATAFYDHFAGCRILEMTAEFVVLAIPDRVFSSCQGNANLAALLYRKEIEMVKKDFMRDRGLKVVPLSAVATNGHEAEAP